MELHRQPQQTAPAAGGGFFLSGDIIQTLVSGEQTDGHSSLSRITVLPGNGQMLHRHAQHETLYVLDGELSFRGARGTSIRTFTGGPGTLLHFPGCVPHSYFNATSQPATMLSFTTPAGLEGFYARAGQRVECFSDASALTSDPLRIESIGWEFGIEPIDPELFDTREGYRASVTYLASPRQGRYYTVLNSLVRIIADADQTEGWLTVLDIYQRPGSATPLHRHAAGCTSFVLDGTFSFTGDAAEGGKSASGGPGNTLFRGPRTHYSFGNEQPGISRMLSFVSPAGIENFIRAIGQEVSSPEAFLSGEWTDPPAGELHRIAALSSELGVDIKLEA